LQALGRTLRAGQRVRFLYTRGEPGVYAWDLPEPPDPLTVDVARYTRLLLRAAHAVLEPFGVTESELAGRLRLRRRRLCKTPASQAPLLPPPRRLPPPYAAS
jgi:hypothetical protein